MLRLTAMQPFHDLPRFGRQIHLDFHTSPFIHDVASEFDAEAFAETMRRARVNSATVFAKCHHGMCYYPTTTGTPHPALRGRDLLGEQLDALHRAGLRAPIYTTVVWEEDAATRHPEWRQLRRDGSFAGGTQPGAWKWLSLVHEGYLAYLEAHVREVLERYGDTVDGLFVDIVMMHEQAEWSPEAIALRRIHGLLGEDRATHARFETLAQTELARRISGLLAQYRPGATAFYNSGHHLFADATQGSHARVPFCSHFEIESLPSGFWGYHHFPRMARLVETWQGADGAPLPWLAMTGRFGKMWGDFGGLKPQAALEYECFRAQALGGANSVGDQLPPRGRLEPAVYDLIGAVYAQDEAAEPFYAGSRALPQAGIALPGELGGDEQVADEALEGAIQMLEELHYEAVVLDDASDPQDLDLVIVPEGATVTDALGRYRTAGGPVITAGRAPGWGLPVTFGDESEFAPTFWRLPDGDRVVYSRGVEMRADGGGDGIVERVHPYFNRTDATFCSHAHAPPRREASGFAAIVEGEGFTAFADPIFGEVRRGGNAAVRTAFGAAVRRLVGPPPFGDGLPATVLVTPRRRGDDLILTLLHYIPVRKALEIDVVDEPSTFAGERLRLPTKAAEARLCPSGEPLPRDEDGRFLLPPVKGRLLIEVPGFFA